MDKKVKNFRDLKIWQKGISLVKSIYSITTKFPKEEVYGLSAQAKRAAVSIPSNISEGFNRFHTKDYICFLYMSLGSCAEVETQIEIAFELNFINLSKKNEIMEDVDHISRMIRSLIQKLKGE